MPLRRKKWTEEEEDSLIAKYGELLRSGFLSKAKSRERNFEPIARHVNAIFHAQNPTAYPWPWTWKDASNKVQNMRHQYLGVKQKIRRGNGEFDWEDGLSHWSNFLKYKQVFGDQELDVSDFLNPSNPNSNGITSSYRSQHPVVMTNDITGTAGALLLGPSKDINLDCENRLGHAILDGEAGDLTTDLGFGYDGEAEDLAEEHEVSGEDCSPRKRMCNRPDFGMGTSVADSRFASYIAGQFLELHAREARREERDLERHRELEKKHLSLEIERVKLRDEWVGELREFELRRQSEAERKEMEYKEAEIRRDMLEHQRRETEKAWVEKMERQMMEWREKMENQAAQHQAAMMQIQLQIGQSHQNTIAMLAGVFLQILGARNGNDISGHTSSVNPLFTQLVQNLQLHGNGVVQCEVRKSMGESSNSHFDVDG